MIFDAVKQIFNMINVEPNFLKKLIQKPTGSLLSL